MQTGIKKVYAPQKAASAIGGFCKWWYVPVHQVARFPVINPFTQQYEEEPLLVTGAQWIGPVRVPDSKRGWEETPQAAKPGNWYKHKVTGFLPGETAGNRILLQNMPGYEYIIVGKLRSSGQYVMIGTPASGLSFDSTFKTGNGGNSSNSGSDMAFEGELPYKAPTLSGFNAFLKDVTLDTTFLFSTLLQPYIPNVTATVSVFNNVLKVRFRKIAYPTGFPCTMRIWFGFRELLVLDFLADYLGTPLEITDLQGQIHLTSFQQATIHF